MLTNVGLFFILVTIAISIPEKCPKNAVFKECTNVCPDKSCDNFMEVSGCFSLRCGPPGCICKEGHVLLSNSDKNQGCVKRETCSKLSKLQGVSQQTMQ